MQDKPEHYVVAPPNKVLGVVLAGGEGRRLLPLTEERAKPAVPFGGTFRIIDFVLSNFVNSGVLRIKVLTQYKSDSLLRHLLKGWQLASNMDQYVEPVPAQQRLGKHWFKGSADALYQSLNVVADEDPDFVCVFGGDHIFKMDIRQMLAFHVEKDAELTVAAVPVPVAEARAFGVIRVDRSGRITGFEEKPAQPAEIPGRPGWALASMGNYIFDPDVLEDALVQDAEQETDHDFGQNILPMLYPVSRVYAYDFRTNIIPGAQEDELGYWRDVGTIDAYWAANMDLVEVKPVLNLYNDQWPLRTLQRTLPPAKFVFADPGDRMGVATDSLVSPGCIISGGRIDRSVLFPGVRINSFSYVEESVLFEGVNVGRYCRIRRAIVDKGVSIPPRTEIGHDPEADRRRFPVSEGGVVVVHKNYRFPAEA